MADDIGVERGGHDAARTIPSDELATAQPPCLARERHVLECVAEELRASGVAGEERLGQLLYLIVTSRLFERPCSIAVKGPSAGGKSYVVDRVLGLFPPSAYYALTAMSERALAYDREPLVRRMLVIYEAAGISGDIASYLVRSLLSEGRINYVTVQKTKNGMESLRITREGPTGLITTTTAVNLHPENETRLLSVTVADSSAQTRAIMLAHALGTRGERDRTEWHDLQIWLAQGAATVVVPYAVTLAEAIPPVAVRLRRDFPTLITLIRAHALIHQIHRDRDADGAIVATVEDYGAVRSLVADLLADAADQSVSPTIRETVEAVVALTPDPDLLVDGVTGTMVGQRLGIDKSTALRRVRVAIARGFVKNLETRKGRPARFVIGDPMPDDASVLPASTELERLHGCMPNEEDGAAVELAYPPGAFDGVDDDSAADAAPWPAASR